MRYLSLAAVVAVSLVVPSRGAGQFLVANYTYVSQTQVTRTTSNVTYKADLVNHGIAVPSVTATLTSLNPSSFTVVPGQGTLNWAPVPANSQTTSSNTFTILVDRTVAFDWSNAQWTFQTTSTPPVANAGPNQTVPLGATVTLNGSGSTNPSGIGTLTYQWQFTMKPAGSAANLANPASVMPTFVADIFGNYIILLTVSNGANSSTASVTVSTADSPPVANAGAGQTVPVGSTVTLNGNQSSDVDGNPLTYMWTLPVVPTGSAATLTGANTVSPSFKADKFGNYTAQLIVNDGNFNSAASTVTISTSHTAPVANAGTNQIVTVGALVQLNGSGSTDIDGNMLTYAWSLNSVPTNSKAAQTLSNPAAVNPTFTVDLPGTYVAQLIVSDPFLSSTPATVMITTNAILAPTANAGMDQTVAHKTTVSLSGSGTDQQGLPLTYKWSLTMKPAGSAAVLSLPNIAPPTFFADFPGKYIAQLIVNNGYLDSAPSMVTITTTNTPPVAIAGPNQSVAVGANVTLDGSGSFDADHDPLTYTWTFLSKPNGSAAALTGANTVSPMFAADQPGVYVVQLKVNDGFADSNLSTVMITAGSIVLTPNPLNLTTAGPGTLTVTIPFAAGNNGQVVNLTIPSIVSALTSVTIPATSTSTTVTVTPVAVGSASILATGPGIQPGSTTVNVVQAAISLSPNPLGVGLTRTATGTITLSGPAPVSGTSVTLTSSDITLATVTPSVTISSGNSTGSFTVTGVALGLPTITASAPGYTSASTTVNVVQLGKIVLPASFSVGPGQSLPYPVSLATPAPANGVTIALSSSDPSTVTISPSTVFIAAQALTPATQPTVSGVKLGTANIIASAGGFIGDTEPVTVGITLSFAQSSTTILGIPILQNLTLNLSAPAPPQGLQINLTSSNTGVATVPLSVLATGSSVSVPVTSVGAGQTTITASSNSSSTASSVVFVQSLGSVSVSNATVGLGQSATFAVSLPTAAPSTGVTVTLSSSDPSTVTITPTTVTILANAHTPVTQPQVSGIAVGSATINASAPGYGSGSATVQVNATLSFPPGTATVAGGTTQNLTLTLSAATPKPLTINLSSDNTAVATVPSTVAFTAASNTVQVPITGVAGLGGSTVIHASLTPNIPDAAVNVTVPPVPVILLPSGVTVGPNQSVPFAVSLSAPAAANVTVNLISDTPSVATITPSTVQILTGATTPASQPTVNGINFGSANITATATGYVSATKQVLVGAALSFPQGPLSTAAGLPLSLTLTLSAPAPASGLTVNLISSNPSAATVPTSVSFLSNATTTNVPVMALAVGATTITATGNAPNVAPANVVVNVTAPGNINLPSNVAVGPGQSVPFTLSLSPAAPPSGVTVTLSSSNPSIATIPASVFIAGGATTPATQPTVSGVNFGTATITASATGYLPVPANPTVTVGAALSFPPGTATISTNATQNLTLSLSQAAGPSGLLVNLSSSNTGVATVPATVVFAANTTSVSVPVTGVATGSATITATSSVSTVSSASAAVSVVNGIILPANVIVPPGNSAVPFPVTLGEPAPGLVFLTLTSSDVSKVALSQNGAGTATFSIQQGQTAPTATIHVWGIDFGSATITATASGYNTVTQTVQVGATLSFSSNPVNINPGSNQNVTLSLSAPPPTGLTVNLSSDNPSVATVPPSVVFGSNVTSRSVTVSGVSTGSTLIHASALPNVPDTTTTIIVGTPGPPVITTTSLPNGQVNVPYSQMLTATGGIAPLTWSLAPGSNALPGVLLLNASTGVISGTPTAIGSTSLTFQVTDSAVPTPQTGTATLTLTIGNLPTPTITTTSLPSGTVNVPYNATLAAIGGTKPYTWSLAPGSNPLPGLLLNATTGAITGTPTAPVPNLSITFQVTDSTTPTAQTATKALMLTIGSGGTLTITTPSLPNAIVAKPYPPQTLMATGGTAPYSWTVVQGSGRLPPNFSLDPSTGIITGTPLDQNLDDIYTFTVQVTDSTTPAPQTATKFLSILVVSGIPAITTISPLPSGQIGVPYSFTLAEQGGTPPFTWSVAGYLAGLTLNASTGQISGTPTAAVTNSRLQVTITDSVNLSSSMFLSLTITNGPPKITTPSAGGTVGLPYSATVSAVGGTTPYTWSLSGQPAGLTINASTGVISGTPTAAGTSSNVVVTVTDATTPTAQTATATFSITIMPPLKITTASLPNGLVNGAYSTTVAATGGTGSLNWSLSGQPPGLTINASTGVISGTPTATGTFSSVVVTVKDSTVPTAQTATATFSITIVNGLGITTPSLPNGVQGTPYSFTMAATGGTGSLAWSVSGQPAGLTINASTGVISGTPTTAGTSSNVVVTVNDAASHTATKTFSITIVQTLTCNATSVPTGTVSVAYSFTITCTGGTPPLTFSAAGLPANLTINASTGVISGTPTAAGPFSVVVTVTDSGTPTPQTATVTFSITINRLLAITTTSPLPSGVVNVAYSTTVAATGGTGTLTWSVSGQPAGLTINASTGVISGTPTAAGTSSNVVVTVTDSTTPTAQKATATFSITIVAKLLITTASLPNGVQNAVYSTTVAATGGTPTLTWSVSGQPAGLTINASTGVISGTPTAAGTSSNVVVTVTDSGTPTPQTATKTFSIVIAPQLKITTTSLPNGVVGTAYSATVGATGGTGTLSWSLSGQPAGLTINASTGVISGTPTAAGTSSSVVVTVTDSGTPTPQTATATFSITIALKLIITTPSPLATGSVNTAYSATVGATGGTGAYNWSVSGQPAGLTINASTGAISGTPTTIGTSINVVVTVTDSGTPVQTAMATFSITIAPKQLVITTASLPGGTVGTPYPYTGGPSVVVMATGGTGTLSWSMSGQPAGLAITPSTGVISGTPTTAGPFNVVVTVTDSGTPTPQTVSATFPITIAPMGPPATPVTISTTSIGQSLQTLVTLSVKTAPPTGSGGLQLTLTSNNPSIVLLNGGNAGIKSSISVTIPENETSVGVYAEGVAIGQTTFTASGSGYSGTGTVTVTPSGFTLSGPNGATSFSLNQGQTAILTVTAVQLDSSFNVVGPQALAAGIGAVTVPLSRSTTNGTVTSSVTFNSGDMINQSAVFTAVNPGPDVLTAGVPAGFSTPAGGANSVTATINVFSCTLPAVTVGRNLETSTANDGVSTVQVTLTGQAQSTLQVVVSSLDSSKALLSTTGTDAGFSSITLTVQGGKSQTPPFYVYGVGIGVLGSTSYSANTGSAFGTCANAVTLAPSGFIFSGPNGSSATPVAMGEQQVNNLTVVSAMLDSSGNPSARQPVAGGMTVNVNVSISDPTIGTIGTSPVQFTGAQGSAPTTLTSLTKQGSATLSVLPAPNAPTGFSTPAQGASLHVSVSPGEIFGLCGDPASGGAVPIGYHLEIACSVELSQPAPADLTVTLSVTSGSNLLLSSDPTLPGSTTITVTIPSGGVSATYYLQALANSGTATYSASALNWGSDSGTVTMTPSGVVLQALDGTSSFTASKGGAAVPIGVSLVQLDPSSSNMNGSNFQAFAPAPSGLTLSVSLHSDNTSAGTVTSPVTVPAGSSSITAQFTPGTTAGTAHITAAVPLNFTMPAKLNTVTATVQ